jgi:multicomponent Na+:H+ antiporter subunit D
VIADHLPALQVVIPLLAAPLCVVLRRPAHAWILAAAVSWTTFAVAVLLLIRVLEHGVLSYHLGGWEPPWGIEYRVDLANAFVLLIVAAVSAVVLPFAHRSVAAEIPEDKAHLFYSMYLLCLTGLLGIAVTGDAFNVFVFLEISSLMGTIGATFYLIGVGLLYAMTGTLNMADLAQRLPAVADSRTVHAAFAFLLIGIGVKAAAFPLHLWLPNAYCYAPSVVTAFLAATATKVSIYVALRILFTVFGPVFSFETLAVDNVTVPFALLAMLSASLVAIFQTNVKRLLAYSSVAQIGYMILGISLGTVTGVTAGIVHLFNHAMIKGGLFLAMGCVFVMLGSVQLRDMAGLGRRMPWTMAAFVIGGLSLIGGPLTTGFISKWVLVQATLERGQWYFAVLILASSLLALVYVWRVVEAAYFRPVPEGAAEVSEAPLAILVPTWLLILANIYFGVDTSLTLGVARRAAQTLLGGAA